MATTTGSKRLLDISANAMAASNSMTYGGLNVATEQFVSTQISNLISSAPATLDTLNELAAALGDDPNFSATVTNSIATKLPLAGGTMTGVINTNSNISFSQDSTGVEFYSVNSLKKVAGRGMVLEVDTSRAASSYLEILQSGTYYFFWNSNQFSTTDVSNWNTAYSWGNHAGLYLGATAKAADSNLLDGIDSTSFLRSDADDTFTGMLTGNRSAENLRVSGIRGQAKGSQTGEYIHLYERVHIGGPSGWGAASHGAPSRGLSVWGSVDFGMDGSGVIQLDGTTIVNASRQLVNVTNTNWDTAYSWGNHASAGYLTSYTETDTLDSVVSRNGSTGNTVNLSSSSNRFNGHHYFDPYDSSGNHYPHYTAGASTTGAVVNTRVYKNATQWRLFVLNGKNGSISWDGNELATQSWVSSQGYITDGNTNWDNIYGFITASSNITGSSASAPKLTDGGGISTHPGTSNLIYTGQLSSGTTGLFAAINNANSIITVNKHPGDYNSQLGFSSNGNIYYRNFNNSTAYTTQAWNQVWHSGNFSNNSANWNTAYNWGNHASAGYLTSVPNHSAALLTSGTLPIARIADDAITGAKIAHNTLDAIHINASAVGASELNVSGNGSSGQVLTSDGDGTFSWTNKTVNTNTTYSTNTAYGTSISGTQIRMNGGEIPSGANLDTYRTQGVFSQNSNNDAANGSNYPEAQAGILCVDDDMYGNGLHTAQTYYIYNSQNVYSRSYYNGTWTTWRNLAQDTNTTYSVGDNGLTEKNFTTALKTKLDGIASGAEVNVRSDWNATSGDALILNKPTIPTNNNQLTNGAGYITGYTVTSSDVTTALGYTPYQESTALSATTGTFSGDITVNGNQVITSGSNADVKFSVWSGTTYGIGMTSGVTYGGLNDYAMTFCMNNDTDRGFWWGYSGQSKSSGAMSLTTAGVLTVASSITAGGAVTGSNLNVSNWDTAYGWGDHAGLYLGATAKAADSNLLDGLDLHTGRNNQANKVVRTDSNGYLQAGWINTTSGAAGTINKIYCSQDDYVRYLSPQNFRSQVTDGVYAPASHAHAIADVTGLQSALDGKQAAGSYAAASHEHDRIFLTDSRGAARAPSYYNDRYAQWDFQNSSDTGAGGDSWHGLLTVSKWTVYAGSHRQEQLAFTGNDLKRRTATSDSAWGSWKTILDSNNFSSWAAPSSHTHVISDITSLQSTLDGKQAQGLLDRNGLITTQDWNDFYTNDKLRVASAHNFTAGANNAPDNNYNYGAALTYRRTSNEAFQMYFPENNGNSTNGNRRVAFRTGWNGGWSSWRRFVDMIDNVGYVTGGNDTGFEVHSDVGYNQDPGTYFLLRGQADNNQPYALKILLTGNASGNDIEWRRLKMNGSDERMYYAPEGQDQITFEYTVVTPSDARLKDNVKNISNPIDKLSKLNGCEFDWNSGVHEGKHDVGVIAQEVEAVIPEAVGEGSDGIKSVAYDKLVPLLIESVKEQQAMIEELKQEIQNLKNK